MDIILSKAMIDCMQNLRRRLRVELNVDIHLSDAGAIEALVAACQHSDSVRTRELGLELARLAGVSAGKLEPVAVASGLQMDRSVQVPPLPAAGGEKLVRIYRGQRVYG